MTKKNFKLFFLFLSCLTLGILHSCQSDIPEEGIPDTSSDVGNFTELRSFDPTELNQMEEILKADGVSIEYDTTEMQTRGIFLNNIFVQAIKVSCKTPHPTKVGTYVDMSGVLLVPKKTIFTSLINHRIMVVPPHTYTSNDQAPSNLFKRVSLISKEGDINSFYFFTLQAKAGYAVLIPDYLGFGDSFGQCTTPYIESKPMVSSIISLIKTAKSQLSANGYRYKNDVIVTGYSQGGFIAASLTRELESNTGYNIPVNLLVTGGTPCNLKQITDIARSSKSLTHTFFLPYAIWGYKQNGYPQINVNDILLEPYASKLATAFDGTNKNANDLFPNIVADLYTEKFIKYLDTDPSMAYINNILDENSVKPWKNKCKFVMTHGISDISVYYQNAKDFSESHKAVGGKVTFYPTIGDHVTAVAPYYLKASAYFALYR